MFEASLPDSLTSLSLGRTACVCSGGIAVGGGTRMSSCGWKSHIDKSWTNPHACTHTQPHIISTPGTLSHSHQNAHIHTVSHSRLQTEHSPSLEIDHAVQSQLHDVSYTHVKMSFTEALWVPQMTSLIVWSDCPSLI